MDNFSISVVDLLLIIVTGFFGFRSLFKGIIKSIFSFLGICAAYLTSSLYYQPVAKYLSPILDSPPWLNLAGFAVVFIAVLILFAIIENTFLHFFAGGAVSKDLAGLLAFILGLLEGFLLCSAILWFLQHRDLLATRSIFDNSMFSLYYLKYNPLLFGLENLLSNKLF